MLKMLFPIKSKLKDHSIVVNVLLHLGSYVIRKRYRVRNSLVHAGPFFFLPAEYTDYPFHIFSRGVFFKIFFCAAKNLHFRR